MLARNSRDDLDKIRELSKSFCNIERINEHGNGKAGRSAKLALHYLTIANQIAIKMMSNNNVKHVLVTSCGIEINVPVGIGRVTKYISLKNNKICVTDQNPLSKVKKV